VQNGLFSGLQSLAPILISVMVLAALAILWRKDRSVWLIVAIVAEVAGLVFRGVMFIASDVAQRMPVFFSLWTLSALVFAAGLLGYALEMNQRR
jgi:hypothetical protein